MKMMETWMKMAWIMLVAAALVAGCETATMDNQGTVSLAELQGVTADTAPADGTTTDPSNSDATSNDSNSSDSSSSDDGSSTSSTNTTSSQWPAEITGSIKWLNTDVSGWAETASLHASVKGGTINMPYSKARVWPGVDGVNANPWAIVNINGKWYAATFEWLKVGQTTKPTSVLSQTDGKGDHFKVQPLSSWRPHSGERFGIMVSGLARGGSLRNVKERSNISMVTWP